MSGEDRKRDEDGSVSSAVPDKLELHSFIDLDHCRRHCPDMGVYHRNELVGAITRQEKRWHVWRIVDAGQPNDRADLAMYEEQMKHMGDFSSLHEAKEYIRGPFCDIILDEYSSREK